MFGCMGVYHYRPSSLDVSFKLGYAWFSLAWRFFLVLPQQKKRR